MIKGHQKYRNQCCLLKWNCYRIIHPKYDSAKRSTFQKMYSPSVPPPRPSAAFPSPRFPLCTRAHLSGPVFYWVLSVLTQEESSVEAGFMSCFVLALNPNRNPGCRLPAFE